MLAITIISIKLIEQIILLFANEKNYPYLIGFTIFLTQRERLRLTFSKNLLFLPQFSICMGIYTFEDHKNKLRLQITWSAHPCQSC